MNRDELILAHQRHLFPAVFHYFNQPLVLERAENQFVYDSAGRQYLDFFGGIVTISVGHANPSVNQAIARQMERLTHVSTCFVTEPMVELAAALAAIAPGEGKRRPTRTFFTNSGTEANETAILAARMYTGSSEVIALRHGYAGRSALAMAVTGQGAWRLGPSTVAGVVHAPNAYCYRCPYELSYPQCGLRCAHEMEQVIRTSTSGKVAALIAEPIQGVGGFITPPPEFFKITADIVRQHGGLFISDEVQTAWGRTGERWWGIEHWGVEPDIVSSAKGLANGLPIGVTMANDEVAAAYRGLTISTFGGNPIATAAGKAVLDFIETNRLRNNSKTVGDYLRAGLERLQHEHALIGDVRGMGLLQAIELVRDRGSKEPAPKETNALLERCKENGTLVGKGGLYGNVVRISPPMNISKDDVDEFLRRLDKSLREVAA